MPKQDPRPATKPAPGMQTSKQDRLAKALRQNLLRRKAAGQPSKPQNAKTS